MRYQISKAFLPLFEGGAKKQTSHRPRVDSSRFPPTTNFYPISFQELEKILDIRREYFFGALWMMITLKELCRRPIVIDGLEAECSRAMVPPPSCRSMKALLDLI